MKLELEFQGVEIKIEEVDGKVVVKAEKDGEVIEEMEVVIGEESDNEPTSTDELPIEGDEPVSDEPEMDETPEGEDGSESEDDEEPIQTFEQFLKSKK